LQTDYAVIPLLKQEVVSSVLVDISAECVHFLNSHRTEVSLDFENIRRNGKVFEEIPSGGGVLCGICLI
jgi:hypothetical protein